MSLSCVFTGDIWSVLYGRHLRNSAAASDSEANDLSYCTRYRIAPYLPAAMFSVPDGITLTTEPLANSQRYNYLL